MTKSRKDRKTDVLIIGGGPAGLSALLWCRDLGMSSLLVEKSSEFGGQLLSIYNPITNYLGREAANGREMLVHFLSQINELEGLVLLNSKVEMFDPQKISATVSDGNVINARAAIIASGVRRRILGVPGEEKFADRGILQSGARDKRTVIGKRVAIIGGGDAALENALIISEFAETVILIHRRVQFSARPEFLEAVTRNPKIQLFLESTVNEFCGDQRLASVSIDTPSGPMQIGIEAALIRIGVQPNTEFLSGKIDLDPEGYIVVDHLGVTNLPNIYAVGDVANSVSPTISSAVGYAATAAKSICNLLYDKRSL